MNPGERLRDLRVKKGLTQQQLAKTIGCQYSFITIYEQNRYSDKINTIQKLCNYFNVTADYLINGVPSEPFKEITVEEMQLVSKYRGLSDYYKSIINHILEIEETK